MEFVRVFKNENHLVLFKFIILFSVERKPYLGQGEISTIYMFTSHNQITKTTRKQI